MADAPGAASRSPAILVVMGVSGVGKTTLAVELARVLGWDFEEGDDYHPPENVRKMASGRALDDDDRGPWLRRLGSVIAERLTHGRPAVVTCSALKERYRHWLGLPHPRLGLVHLHTAPERIAARMQAREGHFMPPALLRSQLDTLEPPTPDEALILDPVAPPGDLVKTVLGHYSLGSLSHL